MDHVNNYGIEESNKIVSIATTAYLSIKNIDTNQDSKVQTLEVLNALQINAVKVLANTPDLAVLRNEVTDYTEEEKEELITNLAENIETKTVKAKVIFERTTSIILDTIDLIIDIRKPEEDFELAA
ncbi:MAG: hypothetical protein AAFO07_04235 [Bacteroidota bacterium]